MLTIALLRKRDVTRFMLVDQKIGQIKLHHLFSNVS